MSSLTITLLMCCLTQPEPLPPEYASIDLKADQVQRIAEVIAKYKPQKAKALEQIAKTKKAATKARSEKSLRDLAEKEEAAIRKILTKDQGYKLLLARDQIEKDKKFQAEYVHLGNGLWRSKQIENYHRDRNYGVIRGGDNLRRSIQEAILAKPDGVKFTVVNRGQANVKSATFTIELFDSKKVRVDVKRTQIENLKPGKSHEAIVYISREFETAEVKLETGSN